MRVALITLALVAAVIACAVAVEVSGFRGARVVDFGLVAVLAGTCAARTRGRFRDLAVTVCSLALGLAVTVAIVPILRPGNGSGGQAATKDDGLVSKRAIVGWGPRHPGVFHLVKKDAGGHVIFDVHATIDAALHRTTNPSAGPRPIAFFGDSFVFGDGLDDGETLPQAFADLNHGTIPVLNLGFSGWAPSQNLAALEQGLNRRELGRPRWFVLFTALFHVERTACKGAFALGSGPRYVLDADALKQAGTCIESRPRFPTAFLNYIRSLTQEAGAAEKPTGRDVETYLKIIEAFVARARHDYGVGTTVLMEPGDDELIAGSGFDQAKIVAALKDAGVDVLVEADPPPGQEQLYHIAGDGHPTALANRATAAQLEAHLRIVAPSIFEKALPQSDTEQPPTSRGDHPGER